MSDTYTFAWLVLVVAATGLFALLSNRLTQWIRIPAPLILLIAAAVVVQAVPQVHTPPERTVDRLVTLALICILFAGGMDMGVRKVRSSAVPIALTGVLGTFLTAGAAAAFVHFAFGFSWYLALLVATAISPTDPAVVFSVLGQRSVEGRAGTILEGESGANDPVGIALMASLITAGGLGAAAFWHIAGEFVLQMAVGTVVGVVGGRILLWFMRIVPLPSEGLYPLRTLAFALIIFGAATLAHGSGFLAVFAAGILLGDERAPFKREIERFHTALASLGEIVAFVVLGLTVDLHDIARTDVWLPGLIIGLVLAAVIRPLFVGLCLLPARLRLNERAFVLFAGLKGAVPILLGGFLLSAHVADAPRLYGIVVTVVVLSVLVQGSLVPAAASLLRLPTRATSLEPYPVGVRLTVEPDGVHRLTVAARSPADGSRIDELVGLPEDAWINIVVRGNELVPPRADTRLRAGDQLLLTDAAGDDAALRAIFG